MPNDRVIKSLAGLHRAKMLARLGEGVLISAAVIIASSFLSALLNMLFSFGPTVRGMLFFISLGAALIALFKYLFPPLARYVKGAQATDLVDAAAEAGSHIPELRDRLRNAVELMSSTSSPQHSEELARAYIERTFGQAATADLISAVKYRPGRAPARLFAVSAAAALLLLVLFPSRLPSALAGIVEFTRAYESPPAYTIDVAPGDTSVSRGDTLRITVHLTTVRALHLPPTVYLSERYEGEKEFERHAVKLSPDGSYDYALPGVRSGLTYRVNVGDQSTGEYKVSVVDLPIVQNFVVKLYYPAYTGKAPETLQDNIGDFSALVGTRAEISLQSNKVLGKAWIAFSDSAAGTLRVEGTTARGSFVVSRPVSYTLRLVDEDSLSNRDPISYSIQAVVDQYPSCEITLPGKDAVLNRDMILPMKISIGDDYGFTKLLLRYKLTSSKFVPPEKEYHTIEIPLASKSAGEQEVDYTWDLTSLGLMPEDVISYHAEVFDNDMIHGPKKASSAEYTLRLPSLEEVFASADSEHASLESNTEKALNSSDELKNQLDRISQEMRTATKQMSWEQQKRMENTVQQYDSLRKKIEGIRQQIENMTEKLLENKIVSPQTLEKYLELQKALQEVNSPEFQQALKKLQQAIQSLSPEQVRQALKNFQMSDEMLRKSIERTLSLIKRIQIEQKLDELQTRAGQMLSRQENIGKSTSESDSSNAEERSKLSSSQEDVRQELARTGKAMSDLKNMMKEFSREMPLSKLGEAEQTADSSGLGDQMQASSKQLMQGNFSQSMSSQRGISSGLRRLVSQLNETQRSLLQNQQKETVDALRKAQQNLLEISKEQEALRSQSTGVMPNSAETRSLASRQNELMQQLGYTAEQLMQLSDKSFAVTPQLGRQIGTAFSQMQTAMNQLQSRNGQSPSDAQSQAMGSLNRAVMNIQGTMQSMMQGQGGSGFPSLMQQLQDLAGKQEGLNMQTRDLGENGSLSMQQQAEISRLAAQQELVRKSLEQLAREADQSQSREQVLGNLNDIAKQMKDVVSDLHNKSITQQTIRRQESILTHLLDASRSIRQRDYDNKRVTRAGTDVTIESPGPLNLTGKQSEEEQELMNLIKRNFPPEYQKVILRYYRLLEKSPN